MYFSHSRTLQEYSFSNLFYVLLTLYCIVFIHFYIAAHSMSLSEALSITSIDTVSEFTRRSATDNCKRRTCPSPYVAVKAGFGPATLRSKGIDSTNAPPRPSTFSVVELRYLDRLIRLQ